MRMTWLAKTILRIGKATIGRFILNHPGYLLALPL